MAIILPQPNDTTASDNHALMHNVVAIDSSAPPESIVVNASGNVGIGTSSPAGILDVTSTTSAFLPPRMTTTQKNAIGSPQDGMVVYDTTLHKLSVYSTGSSTWQTVTSA